MKTILIADHSLLSRSMLKKMLHKSDYRVIAEVEDGKQAIKKYTHCHPDFVLMDYCLPILNGIDALAQIMKHDPFAKVIMFSSMNVNQFIEDSIVLGAKDFLIKPSFEGLIPSLKKNSQ
ncbi:MAG: response regulator [Bacillota bacterium]|nr:response regulator [Bacillota bacterium]MDP4171428.1 response regulator [Bacillota bacterium]